MSPPPPATLRRALLAGALLCGLVVPAGAGDGRPPAGRALQDLVGGYLGATFVDRAAIRSRIEEEVSPLGAAESARLGRDLLKAAARTAPKIGGPGRNHLYEGERGKYLVQGRPGKTLFLGLHGGGEGAGSAESAAGAMGGGGWWWIFPEVLENTERGWTDAGTEEFVVALVEAAKRTGRLDPNRVYITGHSMGGFGAWTIGAHHADLFGGVAAYAGAPVPFLAPDGSVEAIADGILPSYFGLRLHVYQSGDDRNVPPQANDFAMRALEDYRRRFPDGYDFRYERVEGRGHAAPEAGYLPSLEWVAEKQREARPRAFLWQPVLTWKRQMYWVYWDRPDLGALLEVRAREGNVADITVHEGASDLTGLSVLVGAPLFDLDEPVVVRVNGEERFRGKVERRLSTLLLTLPRFDEHLLFDARVDL